MQAERTGKHLPRHVDAGLKPGFNTLKQQVRFLRKLLPVGTADHHRNPDKVCNARYATRDMQCLLGEGQCDLSCPR